jgi:hypothetical protein
MANEEVAVCFGRLWMFRLVTLLLVAFSVGEKNGHFEDSPGSNY